MIGLLSNHLVASAGKEGMSVLTQHGGIGVGLGAMYGAVSDNETIIGGAFRGGVVGAGAGFGAKYFGTKYVQGMNAHAAHTLNSLDPLSRDLVVAGKGLEIPTSSKQMDFTSNNVIAGVQASQRFSGRYNSKAFSFAPKEMESGWFGGTVELDKNVEVLKKYGETFNKRKNEFFADKSTKEVHKTIAKAMMGVKTPNQKDSNLLESLNNRFKETMKTFNTAPTL